MENINLPEKFEVKKIDDTTADIIIEPCFPGYGNTLGNALRRVLLSSLSGAAITSIKIKEASHEFSTLPNVKEDVVEIIMNLKKISFNLHGTEEAKATVKVKGAKKVTAGDIKTTSDCDVINKDAPIATITDKDGELEIEFTINSGRGYLPVENVEKKKIPLGTIAIDAIFTPIKNVNYAIENVRVGQMTNYNRLIINIKTDGSITPEEAVKKASSILVDQFSAIANFGTAEEKIKLAASTSTKEAKDKKEIEIKAEKEESDKKIPAKESKTSEEKTKKKRGRPKKE